MIIPDINDCISIQCKYAYIDLKDSTMKRVSSCENFAFPETYPETYCKKFNAMCCHLCKNKECYLSNDFDKRTDGFKLLMFMNKYANT